MALTPSPLRRRTELERHTGLSRSSSLQRSPLRARSARKDTEIRIRRGPLFRRTRCELAGCRFACWGPIDRHEIVRRPQGRRAAVTPDLVIGLCRAHHALDTYRLEAIALGIRINGWEWRRANASERNQLIKEAAVRRRKARGTR